MNYYERHLGDYAKDTAHLSMLEHGAYTLLLDRYYATEKGIPEDQVYRVARARSRKERKAVDAVLSEFFSLNEGVWRKNRVEEGIHSARARISAARENGRHGGRPKVQHNQANEKPSGLSEVNPEQTHQKPTGLSVGSKIETQTKALQSPISNLQSPDTKKRRKEEEARASRLPTDWVLTDERKSVAEAEHLDPARTFEKFTDHWKAASGSNARKRDWDAAWRNWCKNETDRKPMNGSGAHKKPDPIRYRTADEIEAEERARGDYDAQH